MGILNRSHVKHLLVAYVHGELLPEECVRVARHLAVCGGCRRALAAEEQLAAELSARLPALATPRPGQLARLWPGIAARLARGCSLRSSRRQSVSILAPTFGMALTFGLLCAIVLPVLLGGDVSVEVATQPRPAGTYAGATFPAVTFVPDRRASVSTDVSPPAVAQLPDVSPTAQPPALAPIPTPQG
jgi:anti-sigma factor RsiW